MKEHLGELHGDHDELGDTLHRLRTLTNGYTPPADACAKYHEMLEGLAALEADMYTHVHLENNVLLPRARVLAQSRNTSAE
jgi:regulator of cell morphogenesis and NO signaling